MEKKFCGSLSLIASVVLFSGCVQDGANGTTTSSTAFLAAGADHVSSSVASSTAASSALRPTTTSSTTTPSSSSTLRVSSGEVIVRIVNKSFVPQNITIAAGTVVTWVNDDSSEHQIISDLGYAGSKGGFTRQLNDLHSKRLYKGASYKYPFQRAGSYGYHCNLYPSLRGGVSVLG